MCTSIIVILLLLHSATCLVINDPPEFAGVFESASHPFSKLIPPYPGLSGILAFVDPPDGCVPFTNAADMVGKIAVTLDPVGCFADLKTLYATQAGAIGLIAASTAPWPLTQYSGNNLGIAAIPSISVGGALLTALANSSSPVNVTLYQNPMATAHKNYLLDFYAKANGPWEFAPFGTPVTVVWSPSTLGCGEWFGVTCNEDGYVTAITISLFGITTNIPESLYEITSLLHLDIGANGLTGTISPKIGQLVNIVSLFADTNKLTGPLPATFSNLAQLVIIYLSANTLTSIPKSALMGCVSLLLIDISNNAFTGLLPDLPINMVSISAAGNSFSGPIPDLSYLYLSALDLGYNQFNGTISSFGNPDYLNTISLAGNQLSGTIPASLSLLTALTTLDLSNNKFTGELPDMSAMTELAQLDVANNSLSGVLGANGFPPHLYFLTCSYNKFTNIHQSISNLLTLTKIDASHNSISSYDSALRLPVVSAGSKTGLGLVTIDLSFNQMTSSQVQFDFATRPFLISYSLANNNLSGNPLAFPLSQHALSVLDLSNNNFTGPYLDFLSMWPTLSVLHLDGNKFHSQDGSLPSSFISDYSVSVQSSAGFFLCPGITSSSGAIVTIDYEYTDFQLCKCVAGYRRENISQTLVCTSCPDNMKCPGGDLDALYTLDTEYYPTPNATHVQYMIYCPNCNNVNQTFACKEGYFGRLCSDCGDRYFHRSGKCTECGPWSNFLFSILIILFIVVIVGFGFWFSSYGTKYCIGNNPELMRVPSARATKIRKTWSRAVHFLASRTINNLIIAYYQAITILTSSSPFNINSLLSVAELANLSGIGFGVECLDKNFKAYMVQYLSVVLQPAMVTWVIGLLFFIVYPFVRHTRGQWWKRVCGRALLFILNFLYFPVVTTSISAFRCTADPATGISYLTEYQYAPCDAVSNGVKVLFIMINMVGLFVLFTVLVFMYAREGTKDEEHTNMRKYFSFFVGGFKSRWVYASLGLLVRRLLLSIFTGLLPRDSLEQYAANCFVILISITATTIIQPYKMHVDNLTECVSMVALLVSYSYAQVAIVMGPALLKEDSVGHGVGNALWLLINICVAIWFLILFASAWLRPLAVAIKHLTPRASFSLRGISSRSLTRKTSRVSPLPSSLELEVAATYSNEST